jgi:hypothetical protein
MARYGASLEQFPGGFNRSGGERCAAPALRCKRMLPAAKVPPAALLLLCQCALAQLRTLQGGEFQHAEHDDTEGQGGVGFETANESTHGLLLVRFPHAWMTCCVEALDEESIKLL